MDRSKLTRLAAVALAAGVAASLVAAPAAPATAGPGGTAGHPAPASPVSGSPEQLAALARDLGLSTDQALAKLTTDRAASDTAQALRERLGAGYAGAWLDGDQLIVAVTEPDQEAAVRAAGAHPRVVRYSERALDSVVAQLARLPAPDPDEVYGWGVDATTNQVVVRAATQVVVRVRAWLLTSGVDPAKVRVEASTGAPAPAWDVIGGNRYDSSSGSCSIGFSVRRGSGDRGYVTAGHCGTVGTNTNAFNGSSTIQLGTFQNSNFPGVDMAYVKVRIYAGCTRPGNVNCWFTRPWVNRYGVGGSIEVVVGSQEAPIGAGICRSGATTGWHCGTVTSKNQTVNYAEGQVHGLTFTSVCVEPGDSGGAYVALGGHAQGVTSGGTTPLTCSLSNRISFFQPLSPILSSYGLTLITG
jgi:streptogrisin C